jgi:hypothetical protein
VACISAASTGSGLEDRIDRLSIAARETCSVGVSPVDEIVKLTADQQEAGQLPIQRKVESVPYNKSESRDHERSTFKLRTLSATPHTNFQSTEQIKK